MTMKAPVFVFTQALSAKSLFPKWLDYYSRAVGRENLFVLTDEAGRSEFDSLGLGGILSYPGIFFDDGVRGKAIASIVAGLLEFYRSGIVVDTDKFTSCRIHENIRAFSTSSRTTALRMSRALEWILSKTHQNPISISQKTFSSLSGNSDLSTRRYARQFLQGYQFAGVWDFIYSSVYPKFSEAILIHLKRADRRLLLDWQTFMSGKKIVAEITAKYYVPDQNELTTSPWLQASGRCGKAGRKSITTSFSLNFSLLCH